MKKINTIQLFALLVLSLMTSVISAQFTCYVDLNVSLDPAGEYILFPEDILADGDLSGLDATVSPSFFTCQDLGVNEVVLDIYDGAELIFSCTTNILVDDQIAPTAICQSSPEFTLDASGMHLFSFEDLDNGSWDECGIAQFQIIPAMIQCGDANPLPVTFIVMDEAGNASSCITNVTWSDYPDPTPNLACNADVSVFLVDAEELEITADMILEGGPYACPDHYLVEISENMVPRAEPKVTLADTNKMLVTKITDLSGGGMCWGELHVYPDGNCGEPFVACDTACRNSPFGDCASGHTADDNVEWPCDLVFNDNCDLFMEQPTPEFLLENNLADSLEVFPEIINQECFITNMAFEDMVFLLGNEKRIERKWSIIDWQTAMVYTYIQTIYIYFPGITICDTLPWNAPVGDCDSGHTLDDAIEWPADITVHTIFVSPQDLAQNPEVASEDVEPQLTVACSGTLVNYTDVYFTMDDTTVVIERTWGVFEVNSGTIWSYAQHITIENISGASVVCVTRENGEPIPGVTLSPGVVTDESGCYSFDEPMGVIVTPVKDSPLQEGVNLLDKILAHEGVLGLQTLSFYQNKAADLSQTNGVTTLDLVYFDKIIDGTFTPTFDHNWMFYDQSSHLQSVDISNPLLPYHFIGVKMGDIDNSFVLPLTSEMDPIGLQANDEILNKKEQYEIPFILNENVRVLGFSITLENPGNNLNFTNLLAPELPGFNLADHVVFEPGAVLINYIVPEEYLESGIALTVGTPLFSIAFSPSENTFLSQELQLGSNQDNVLRSSRNTSGLEFTLDWENVIVSSVIGAGAGLSMEFFPNPVTNEIHLKGIPSNQQGLISVIDPLGRLQFQSVLTENADLSTLAPGMYYLQVRLQNGQTYSAPLSKM